MMKYPLFCLLLVSFAMPAYAGKAPLIRKQVRQAYTEDTFVQRNPFTTTRAERAPLNGPNKNLIRKNEVTKYNGDEDSQPVVKPRKGRGDKNSNSNRRGVRNAKRAPAVSSGNE